MKILGRVAVFPGIPPRIARLHELAYNLWWTWNAEAQALYACIDPDLWTTTEHNAVRVLAEAALGRLKRLAEDPDFLARYDAVLAAFDAYMHPDSTWFSRAYPEAATKTIAYFSAEFGLHESLPIYSGGLGILSGDHCKEASDLGLPLVGVGFLYPQGYFRQRITREGQQEALYEKLNFSQLAATAATDPQGREVIVSVDLPGRKVYAKVWRFQVGRMPLYLMDTDVEPNGPSDRTLSARLYGGDHEMRIAQEIMLGIGGVRALRALDIDPLVWHMNEGHSAFLGLERCRELVQGAGLTFDQAREVEAANAVFTTHTPVAAGNDVFGYDLVERYFHDYWPQLGLNRDTFLALAREDFEWGPGFSMTVLALKLSAQHNGVSRLHGDVSRRMWHFLWPDVEVDEVPIGSITNGVHTATWLAPQLDALYRRHLGADWYAHLDEPALWQHIGAIPDGELWEVHRELKGSMIAFARRRLARQRTRIGEGGPAVSAAASLLDPEALTLGFARRSATYKRATLLFRDRARLARLLADPQRPVQIVFAGKAHPNDRPGQDFIRAVYEYSRQPEFEGRIVFLEDYDMDMARHLVSGVDVWLNTPIRPHEASGTSGQKASLNGIPNCSIIDGWWEEGYNGANGWAIGEQREYQNAEMRDETDALALYDTLEHQIIPLYYDRGLDGVPHQWVATMKEAIRTIAPVFSMRRMVKEYAERLYVPALQFGQQRDGDHFRLARELAAWKQRVSAAWSEVAVQAEGPHEERLAVGEPVAVRALVRLGGLKPEDVAVELVAGMDENGTLRDQHVTPMELVGVDGDGPRRYEARLVPGANGSLVYGVRVIPRHAGLAHPFELGLGRWA
ncbi:MAG: alpha-glucan family phosphorylase [Ktedonobacterales bacterium]